ncbi:DNA-binding transcriptional regulator [Parelusimicrobium proximum]|uniref:metal-sensing transcriptional repressor n=1 Tax=Parelusimicrobium proximum TaxID=3228953 RepID=UPI003D177FC4
MKDCADIKKVSARLGRIEGQIRGVNKMVTSGAACDDILVQIGAIKAALHKVGQIILEGHLEHCVVDGIQKGDSEKTVKKFTNALEKFSRII